MQALQTRKQNQHDSLCEELLRERAAVLSRAGFAVEDALEKLMKMNQQIEEKIKHWQSVQNNESVQVSMNDKTLIFEEINSIIDLFNTACQKAETQYYYLIVTREALGLRRHETVRKLYQIPAKKKKIRVT
jgi:hypothetical protein